MIHRILVWPIGLALAGMACSSPAVAGRGARQAVETIHRTVEDAFARRDANAIARIYTDDAEWYVPETPVLRGRNAIASAWRAQIGSGDNRLHVDVAEVEEARDWAHETGRFTINAPDGSVVGAAKYLTIWTRQPDGEWKARREIYNWDIPPVRP